MKSTKFEYALYQIPPRQGGESETFFQCRRLAELNIYGGAGWEAIKFDVDGWVIFKRVKCVKE